MNSEEFIEGNKKVQWAFGFLVVVCALVFVFVQSTIGDALATIQQLLGEDPALAAKMAGRLLLWVVFTSGAVAVLIGGYLLFLIRKIKQEQCYPPSDYPVAVRTRVRRGEACNSVIRAFWIMAIVLLLQPLVGGALWYWVTGGYW